MNIKLGNNVLTWNIVIVICIVFMIGGVLFDQFAPKPNERKAKTIADRKERAFRSDLNAKSDKVKESESKLNAVIWDQHAELVTPQILKSVNLLADKANVKVKSFRPQKSTIGEEMERLTYVALVEGKYQDVSNLVRMFDEPSSQFSVYMVQIASADSESDQVNGTIGIVAYTKAQ